jgi:hypothetical protein
MAVPDAQLDQEFAYIPWRSACRNLYDVDMFCRRPSGHDEEHAAGFGQNRKRW